MGAEFTPIFLFILVAVLIAFFFLAITHILGPKKKTAVKQMPYESGMDPIGDARQRFDVRFYLVAIVFLLFDVELLFLYPWAVAQWSVDAPVAAAAVGPDATVPVVVVGIPAEFRGWSSGRSWSSSSILAAAFAYAWRKGVFEWR